MELPHWFAQHGFTLLQSIGIIAGLLFNALSLRADAKSRRVSNFITVTAHHREIWTPFAEEAEVTLVLEPHAAVNAAPVPSGEGLLTHDTVLDIRRPYH